jgi:hypothetical protein
MSENPSAKAKAPPTGSIGVRMRAVLPTAKLLRVDLAFGRRSDAHRFTGAESFSA